LRGTWKGFSFNGDPEGCVKVPHREAGGSSIGGLELQALGTHISFHRGPTGEPGGGAPLPEIWKDMGRRAQVMGISLCGSHIGMHGGGGPFTRKSESWRALGMGHLSPRKLYEGNLEEGLLYW